MASVHKLIHVGITGLFVSFVAGVAAKLLFYVIWLVLIPIKLPETAFIAFWF